MNKVHIVVDSTANIPQDFLRENENLHVVPIKIIIGEQVIDEPELTADEIFEYVESKEMDATTSQPAPGEFAAVFDKITAAGDYAVVVTVSAGVSGTWQCAGSVARQYAKNQVLVVDSCSAGVGLLNLVRQGLALAQTGKSAKEIAELLETAVARNDIYILPGTLEYLHKGGRIGGAAALFGSLLQIKPILTVENGKIAVLDKVRTRSKALLRIMEELPPAEEIEWIGITHTERPQPLAEVIALVRENIGIENVEVAELGASLAVHFGPGCVVVMLQRKK
ncbi:MAG: DegV family protein [Negativicutes bacterium]|jgi:DegV family protein with EDD domain